MSDLVSETGSTGSQRQIERRTVRFTGHVQGVGFRYTTRSVAQNFSVGGFVRNLPDGNVELVVEGSTREIDLLVESIQQQMGQFIRETKQATQSATGEFTSFAIRH